MKTLCNALALALLTVSAHAARSTGSEMEMTKSLIGSWGSAAVTVGDYSLAFTMGEPMAGHIHGTDPQMISGYIGGSFGVTTGLQLLRSRVGTKAFYQDTLQVGVPVSALMELEFSETLSPATLDTGIQLWKLLDHLGQATPAVIDLTREYTATTNTVKLTPQSPLESNTLYEIRITQSLLSVDGYTVDSEQHIRFVTLLDPALENVILYPLIETLGAAPLTGAGSVLEAGGVSVQIPAGALQESAMVLFNENPTDHPMSVNPDALREANRKAAASAGAYRTPIKLREINAYNSQGQRISGLSKTADITFAYESDKGLVKGTEVPVKSQTLSLWTLDEAHNLWVKIPGSRANGTAGALSASVPHFSVYALMGGPSGSASDVFVFPTPWRPHGPSAGTGNGQTGTVEGGITFTNLPSECTIRIYTITGELIRTLQHSDLSGSLAQERWDGRTSGGEAVASGVYLWRVESSVDGKNGKLMVIR